MPPRLTFSALQHPCNEPGCNCWFRNIAGLTQHRCINHPCLSLPNQGFSNDILGQEDYEAQGDQDEDMMPPITDHNAADEGGHQECNTPIYNNNDLLGQECERVMAEFVGPGRRLYRNYHVGLNGKLFCMFMMITSTLICLTAVRRCDAHGQFLLDDAPPLPTAQKSLDNWTPYRNWLEFELADFIFMHAEMPAKKIDTLLEIWAVSLLPLGGQPLFANHTDLYHVIVSTCIGKVKWERFMVQYANNGQDEESAPWMSDIYDIWYQDPCEVVHNLLSHSDLTAELDLVPYHEYDATNDQRCWQDFMLGDWAWQEAVSTSHFV